MTDYTDPGWGDPGNRLHPDGAPGDGEMALRKMLGDSTYERLIKNSQRYQELQFDSFVAHSAAVRGKAGLWAALSFLVVVATLLGVGWSVFWWVS